MSRLPIRLRLTLWYFCLFAFAGLLLSTASWFLLEQSLDSLTQHELDERVDDIQSFLASKDPNTSIDTLRAELLRDYRLKDEGKWLQVLDEHGNWLYRSERRATGMPIPPLPPAPGKLTKFHSFGGHRLRTLTRELDISSHTYTISMAMSADQSVIILADFRRDLFLLVPVVLLMAAVAGYLLSRRALEPVAAIAMEARRINDRNLDTRLPRLDTHDELAHLSDTLNQMLERIEVAFRSVRAFTANASHELRTPLSLIRTRVEVALCFPRTAETYKDTLEEVQQETVRMTALIENLLALARADAGAEQPKLEAVEITQVVSHAAREWTAIAERLSLQLFVETGNRPIWVLGDEASLQRLIRILLDNACRYTPSGGQITLRIDAEAGVVMLSVCDTGIGMTGEQIPFIFDRFYRGDKSRGDKGSSGLGLALAKWIAEQHKASISVESEPGRGSCFRVNIQKHSSQEHSSIPQSIGS